MNFTLAMTERIFSVNTDDGWCSVHVKDDGYTNYQSVEVYDQDGDYASTPVYNEVLEELKKQGILTGVLV